LKKVIYYYIDIDSVQLVFKVTFTLTTLIRFNFITTRAQQVLRRGKMGKDKEWKIRRREGKKGEMGREKAKGRKRRGEEERRLR